MKATLIACALAALTIATAANAQPGSVNKDTLRLAVPFGDLDLSRPAGAQVMMRRIRFAATEACGGLPFINEVRERKAFKVCLRQTMADAVGGLGAPLVTAAFHKEIQDGRLG
jgi:UrcA family protein